MAREGPEFQRGRAVLQSPVRSWKSYDVISEIDIWRAATLMLKRYGEKALEESASARRRARIGTATGIAARGFGSNGTKNAFQPSTAAASDQNSPFNAALALLDCRH
jgi:hypothetical protein